MTAMACDHCLRRTWLLGRLSGHINIARRALSTLLAADDESLIRSVSGRVTEQVLSEYRAWTTERAAAERSQARAQQLDTLCRCEENYPPGLISLGPGAPRVLHIAGGMDRFLDLSEAMPVAIIGARQCTQSGREVSRRLAYELARTGLTVLSGMAIGIDAAAHRGAIEARGNTIAVMPCSADISYPASARKLHGAIIESGVAISELGPGVRARPWTFRARNRILVALASGVVVVQAHEDSGTMKTVEIAEVIRRPVGAVPGVAGGAASAGTHSLIKARRAVLVENVTDVLDLIHLPNSCRGQLTETAAQRVPGTESERRILLKIADGIDTAAAIASTGVDPSVLIRDLAQLELDGWIRRGNGGQFVINR